jgi:hypothetical protein
MSCLKVRRESGQLRNATINFWQENVVSQRWAETGRGWNGTPKFWWENFMSQSRAGNWPGREQYAKVLAGKLHASKLGGKVVGSGTVHQSFGGKSSCLKVAQESGLVWNGTSKFWRENIVSQSRAEKWPDRERYAKALAGKHRVSK